MSETITQSWNPVSLKTKRDDASLTAMCHGTVIRIKATVSDLRTAENRVSALSCKFKKLVDRSHHDWQVVKELECWMIAPCLEQLQNIFHNDQGQEASSTNLQDYFHEKAFFFQMDFRLKNCQGLLTAVQCPAQFPGTAHMALRVPMFNRTVSFAHQQGVPCVSARHLQIAGGPSMVENGDINRIPKLLRISGERHSVLFKAAIDKNCFERELKALMRIRDVDHDRSLKTSRLLGLAQWDGDGSIAGLLLEYIAGARSLCYAVEGATPRTRNEWVIQLEQTLSKLHQAGIVWGDAAVHNILIDSQDQAWITDFDYGCYHTAQRDRQELVKISDFLNSGLSWAEWNAAN